MAEGTRPSRTSGRPEQTVEGRRPNFVVVFMDDMGYGDMGCFGSRAIRTPAMDGVAARGAKFSQVYAAAPISTPSRCGLLTGRYPQRAERANLVRVLFPKDTDGITEKDRTVAEYLKEAGYGTCCLGKWHLGCLPEHYPTRHGFDHYFGLLYSNDMDPLHLYRNEEAIETEVDQATLTRRYTDEAIEFIEEHVKANAGAEGKDARFFVYLAHTMPHIPLHVEKEFRGKSAGGTYGDTIECIDFHLQRLLDKLDDVGLTEDTLVIVTSDNGPWFEGSTGGLRGRKFDTYEGGVRMPFVAQWPAVTPAGTVREEPATLMDLLPTFCALAGAETSPDCPVDGIDITPALRGEAMPEHEAIFYYSQESLNAVRVGRWKLHVARGNKGQGKAQMPQLFDMEIDEGESYNVANRHPEVVERLKGMIEGFDAEIKAEREKRQG